jgi:high-affinity iron transporter
MLAIGILASAVPPRADASETTSSNPRSLIEVSSRSCAPNWRPPHSGRSTLTVANLDRQAIFGVEILGADQTTAYGEIEMLAPATTRPMPVDLPPGKYSVLCESFSGSSSYSAVKTVTGPAVKASPSYQPVNAAEIQAATLAYRLSLASPMTQLVTDTDALLRAIHSGDLDSARHVWLNAHLDYERLGAAYDTFGPYDDKINEKPLGLVGGPTNPSFHGFFRLEYGLWHGQTAASLEPAATQLDQAVHGLLKAFPTMLMPANDLSLRAHEILENCLQFELTGELDEGSHTSLATTWANVQGTELALDALRPLLDSSDPALLRSISAQLSSLAHLVRAFQHPDGSWTPLGSLSTREREHLDATVGSLLETLSIVPDRLGLAIRPGSDDD